MALRDATNAERNSPAQPSRPAASTGAVPISGGAQRPLVARARARPHGRRWGAAALDVGGELALEVLPGDRPDGWRPARSPPPPAAAARVGVRVVVRAALVGLHPEQEEPDQAARQR